MITHVFGVVAVLATTPQPLHRFRLPVRIIIPEFVVLSTIYRVTNSSMSTIYGMSLYCLEVGMDCQAYLSCFIIGGVQLTGYPNDKDLIRIIPPTTNSHVMGDFVILSTDSR